MKIDNTCEVSAKLICNNEKVCGKLYFNNDMISFKPERITLSTPEIKIPFLEILDAFTQKTLFFSTSFTIINKNSDNYTFSTMQSGNIMRFLFNKF